MTFSVRGQHVTVVGAARSGIAAALLLAGRGARVTLTDTAQELDAATSTKTANGRYPQLSSGIRFLKNGKISRVL